jgi:hypothetical protein
LKEIVRKNFYKIILFFALLVLAILLQNTWQRPLQGLHGHRQADTLYTAYNYCLEDGSFFRPRVIFRGESSGISIGELPLFSGIISLPCVITGTWTETAPKWLTLIIFLLAGLVWTLWLQDRIQKNNSEKSTIVLSNVEMFGFFIFTSLFLVHLSIPIPDGLAVLLIGLAAYVKEKYQARWSFIFALLFFTLGFWMRPYLIFLGPAVFNFNRKEVFWGGATVVCCALTYVGWYKWWAPNQSSFLYYNTSILPFREAALQFPNAFLALLKQIISEHLNFVALPLLYLGLSKNKQWALFWALSGFGVLFLRGLHIYHHHYYLLAMGLWGWMLVVHGYAQIKTFRNRSIIYFLFLAIGILHNQHLWHKPKTDPWILITEQIKTLNVAVDDFIAVYSDSPTDLYYAKRKGFLLGPQTDNNENRKECPAKANYFIFYKDDVPVLEKCR